MWPDARLIRRIIETIIQAIDTQYPWKFSSPKIEKEHWSEGRLDVGLGW
jgi:hypothetical protein